MKVQRNVTFNDTTEIVSYDVNQPTVSLRTLTRQRSSSSADHDHVHILGRGHGWVPFLSILLSVLFLVTCM